MIGVFVHFGVATIIGIVVGIILYKTKILNISKISTAPDIIREAKTVLKNLISIVRGNNHLSTFDYSSKGSMAKIGKHDGVARMMGINLTGFAAWFVWKQYYLSTLPVMEKRIRVGLDWFVDLFFTRDITKLN